MEWIVGILAGVCTYLLIRCMQLDTQITNAESKIRQEFRDVFVNEVRNTMVKLADHVHDPATGYVDRMSIVDGSSEEKGA